MSKRRPNGIKGGRYAAVLENNTTDEEKSKGKGPEIGIHLTCSSWGKGNNMLKAGEAEGQGKERNKNNDKAHRSMTFSPLCLDCIVVPYFTECFNFLSL